MYVCNPLNMEYKYQLTDESGKIIAHREGADPSLVLFHGKYYLFPSMTAGFLVSDNLTGWSFHSLEHVPIYDYAPDVRVIGEYLYFSASNKSRVCSFYRTKDPIHEGFEEIKGTFPFWDPNLFMDDDGRIYFYWGCSNLTPIYGVELNPENMKLKSEPQELIFGQPVVHGYERVGENHMAKTPEQIEELVVSYGSMIPDLKEEQMNALRIKFGNAPYIEGAWMDKHDGKYYLQYASPATENNIYSDGVYISDQPLGPFTLAANNPFSYKPGGFIPGAGHGSTMKDKYGNLWHASTMRISVNHIFERRVGLWPAGFDADGELFCNQRYGDWPYSIEQTAMDPWKAPEWMLLSYGKPANASSCAAGYEASLATNENVQTWWKAASSTPGQWLEVDLQQPCGIAAIQINFADDQLEFPLPAGSVMHKGRFIDETRQCTRWVLEGSLDGETYFMLTDKSEADSDLPHDFIILEGEVKARYIRCTVRKLPYNQQACISGLRIFGISAGELPGEVSGVRTELLSKLDLSVSWDRDYAVGYNVLWGFAPDKLYHSYMVLGSHQVTIKALIQGQPVYVRVDAFNESGITEGVVKQAV
ncbi:1,4-beta-xylanase [Paenibacillus sp. FSL P4-0081]|uniref:family 43 glycosylhydrolase n=2 Tax=unclassified Paenibacillus TaxID=185978 RepID=UPI0004F84093|nr:family 43 glycosylhydrolase [Paenibacillus sp. FSL P4-0081]AIQ31584.1 1,4-beta-xylanase [Paenibacillus sp. FSL P4-0081]